jgi:Flp pilus assembly protein CpaB
MMMIGIVLLVGAGLATYFVMFRGGPAQPQQQKFKQVLAIEEIPPHVLITKEMVYEKEFDSRPPEFAAAVEEVVGRVSTKIVEKDKPLTRDGYSDLPGQKSKAPVAVPEGKRAMAILVDPERGIGGLVTEGDHVDILVVYAQDRYSLARTVAQDIEVLATETTLSPPPPQPPAEPGKAPPAPAAAPVKAEIRVILSVSPTDAERILAAADKGKLNTVLRNPKSREFFVAKPEGSWEPLRVVERRVTPPRPTPPLGPTVITVPTAPGSTRITTFPTPPAGKEVTVIRGSTREMQTVPR